MIAAGVGTSGTSPSSTNNADPKTFLQHSSSSSSNRPDKQEEGVPCPAETGPPSTTSSPRRSKRVQLTKGVSQPATTTPLPRQTRRVSSRTPVATQRTDTARSSVVGNKGRPKQQQQQRPTFSGAKHILGDSEAEVVVGGEAKEEVVWATLMGSRQDRAVEQPEHYEEEEGREAHLPEDRRNVRSTTVVRLTQVCDL